MKKRIVLLAVFFLAACMDVEDFGTYWAKTDIDAGLAGNWKQVEIDDPLSEDTVLNFAMKNGSYEVKVYENGKVEEKPYYPVRTLKAGPYLFLAVGPKEGGMVRYKTEGNRLSYYHFDGDLVSAFLVKNFPVAANPDLTFHGGTKAGVMNDTTYKAISSIPDTPDYWQELSRYEKQP